MLFLLFAILYLPPDHQYNSILNYASSSPLGNSAGNTASKNPTRERPPEQIAWSATLLPKVISE